MPSHNPNTGTLWAYIRIERGMLRPMGWPMGMATLIQRWMAMGTPRQTPRLRRYGMREKVKVSADDQDQTKAPKEVQMQCIAVAIGVGMGGTYQRQMQMGMGLWYNH